MSRTSTRQFGDYTPAYEKRRTMPIPPGFIAVANETRRRPLVHIVRAPTFGAVAKLVMQGRAPTTICEKATVGLHWSLIPRDPNGGYLVSCAFCRARMLEGK